MGGVKADWRVHPENLLKILSKEASQNKSLIEFNVIESEGSSLMLQ